MSLLLNVADSWMEESHPQVAFECCLNAKQRKFVCTKCRDICPNKVYNSPGCAWVLCEDCNLCVVACPTQAICPSSSTLGNFLHLLGTDKGIVTIACDRADATADLIVSCFGAVPWEMVACFALDAVVALDTGSCSICDRCSEKDQLSDMLARAARFLGTSYFTEHVRFDLAVPEVTGVSRRDALGSLLNMFRKTAAGLLPNADLQKSAYSAFYRKVLVGRLQKMREEGSALPVTWETPVFSEACTACSICSKVCVHGAIQVAGDAEDETVRYILHAGHRCVHCGLCETLCPTGAIKAWTTYSVSDVAAAVSTRIICVQEPEARKVHV